MLINKKKKYLISLFYILPISLIFGLTLAFFLSQNLDNPILPSLPKTSSPSPLPAKQTQPKKKSDISYIWLYIYSLDADVLVEHNSQFAGKDENGNKYDEIPRAQYFGQGTIANSDDPSYRWGGGTGGTMQFLIPKPEEGKYTFSFTGPSEYMLDIDLHLFGKNGGHIIYDVEKNLTSEGRLTFILELFKDFDVKKPVFSELLLPRN